MIYWFLFQLAAALFLVYFYIKRKYNFWSNVGVAGPKPSLFQLGNLLQIGKNPPVMELEFVRKYGQVYGSYSGLQPVLTIVNAELIKQVMVQDFAAFNNRRKLQVSTERIHLNMFFTDDAARWKRIRALTSPNFTSGKLRKILPMMDRSVDKLVDYLAKVVKSDRHGVIDTKAVIAGFSLDTFASTSFGIDTNTNNDRSDTNRLLSSALKFIHISPLVGICYYAMPKWFNRLINVKHFFNVESFDYFENVAREVVRQRIQSNRQPEFTKRNDVLDLLIDAVSYEENVEESTNYDRLTADMGNDVQENSTNLSSVIKAKTTLSEMEIIAQTIAFFVAGYETTASAISHTLFELAINQTIQKRLAIELADALQNLDDNSEQYYETVCNKIPYLDAVINETLRKYPVLYRLERRCVVDGFKLAGIPLQKDQVIEIAKYATHYNAEYFPEPERFNPDRFMPENKHLLVPYSFLPFGQGPRNCIGMRFAYQEIKLCLTKIVRQFVFRPTALTPAKLQLSNYKPVLGTKAFEIKVEMR